MVRCQQQVLAQFSEGRIFVTGQLTGVVTAQRFYRKKYKKSRSFHEYKPVYFYNHISQTVGLHHNFVSGNTFIWTHNPIQNRVHKLSNRMLYRQCKSCDLYR